MRLVSNHLSDHKFEHDFNDAINPICICRNDTKSRNFFFLHCPEYCRARQTLFENIQSIAKTLLIQN